MPPALRGQLAAVTVIGISEIFRFAICRIVSRSTSSAIAKLGFVFLEQPPKERVSIKKATTIEYLYFIICINFICEWLVRREYSKAVFVIRPSSSYCIFQTNNYLKTTLPLLTSQSSPLLLMPWSDLIP